MGGKKGLKALGVIAAAAILAAATASGAKACGDTGFLGGKGANLFPVDTRPTSARSIKPPVAISMVSEEVQLSFADREWHVDASYGFRNNSDHVLTVRMAFPELRCDHDYESCEGEYRYDQMRAEVGGQAVPLVPSTLEDSTGGPPGDIGGEEQPPSKAIAIWTFGVTFAPRELVSVRHRYQVPASGYDWDSTFSLDYVAARFAGWDGPVEDSRFRFRVPLDTTHIEEDWLANAGLMRTGATEVETEYGTVQEVVFAAQPWLPQDFTFALRTGRSPFGASQGDPGNPVYLETLLAEAPERAGFDESERCPDFLTIWRIAKYGATSVADWLPEYPELADAPTRNSASICENQMFAVFGMRFQDDRLNRYFYGTAGWVPGPWPYGFLEPNPAFDVALLSPVDWTAIEMFREVGEQAAQQATEERAATERAAEEHAAAVRAAHRRAAAEAEVISRRIELRDRSRNGLRTAVLSGCHVWRRGDPWCLPWQLPR